jgi:hypothetical protein
VSVGRCRLTHARGHGLTGGAGSGMHQGGKLGDHVDLRHVAGKREHIVEAARISERHLRAAFDGSFTHAMRKHRHFMAQIRTHDENAFEVFDLRNFQP